MSSSGRPAAPLRVVLAGVGTVGGGVVEVLARNGQRIEERAGRLIELVGIADLDQDKASLLAQGRCPVFADAKEMLLQTRPDVLVELIGGCTYARSLVIAAI